MERIFKPLTKKKWVRWLVYTPLILAALGFRFVHGYSKYYDRKQRLEQLEQTKKRNLEEITIRAGREFEIPENIFDEDCKQCKKLTGYCVEAERGGCHRTFGGDDYDFGYSVQQTNDGGYIIGGCTRSPADLDFEWDVYLIKTDSSGILEWERFFGGNKTDWIRSVQQTTDGGYIATGTTHSFGAGESDVYLIKTDSFGDLQWQKTFGGVFWDQGYSVQQTNDGGYIIAGAFSVDSHNGDAYLIKTDISGNLQWQKNFDRKGTMWDNGFSVQQTSDGGYIMVGTTESDPHLINDPLDDYDVIDVYLIKTDSFGNKEWEKTFDITESEEGYSVQQTNDGGYIITGNVWSFSTKESDVFLIKTDNLGNLEWQKIFGGDRGDYGHSVKQTIDGGYIIAGHSNSFGYGSGDVDAYIIKTDSLGNLQLQKNIGGASWDEAESVQQTNDGGYIVIGHAGFTGGGGEDVYLFKLSEDLKLTPFPSPHHLESLIGNWNIFGHINLKIKVKSKKPKRNWRLRIPIDIPNLWVYHNSGFTDNFCCYGDWKQKEKKNKRFKAYYDPQSIEEYYEDFIHELLGGTIVEITNDLKSYYKGKQKTDKLIKGKLYVKKGKGIILGDGRRSFKFKGKGRFLGRLLTTPTPTPRR